MKNAVMAGDYRVEIPAHFFGYTSVKVLGAGSFSVVILATQDETGDSYAVKLISRQFLVDHNFVVQFQRELTIFSTFDHPNVLKFVGVLDDENLIYVVMEYCPMGTLHEMLVSSGALSENTARLIAHQIVSAISYLHSLDIAHRDLKPENILIADQSTVKIADFGFSRENSGQTLFRTQCGSPLYASPEVISSIPYDGKAADMWSVGVIIFALVTGRVPWEDVQNQNRLFYDIQTARYHIPANLSQNLANLLGGLMNPQPLMRFTVAQALSHPWLEGGAAPTRKDSGSGALPSAVWAKRRQSSAMLMHPMSSHPDQKAGARPRPLLVSKRMPETHRAPPTEDA
jgi:serine/threonine protein kinase